jgi:uncharacterized protein (TIGR01777 family)
MRIGMTGSSGLVGTALRKQLESEGHEVKPFIRGAASDPNATWDPSSGWVRPSALDGLDAVVNLAGDSIGEGRWTAAKKARLRSSRIDLTRLLVSQFEALPNAPALISASAVGLYGNRGEEVLEETSGQGNGFLAQLAADWEAEARRAESFGSRVAILRLGVVIAPKGGALDRMVLPFKLFAGGPIGNGKQWFSWVAIDDAVAAFSQALTSDMSGAYNLTAPNPVTNRQLAKTIGATLHRPSFFPVPGFMLRLALGGAADELLLASQRVIPARLTEANFDFRYPAIEPALQMALKGG